MSHPREVASQQEQIEAKLKSCLMNFLYRQYLLKKSDEEVIAAVAQKDLPRIDRFTWWKIKQWFREREAAQPSVMAQIRKKIGISA